MLAGENLNMYMCPAREANFGHYHGTHRSLERSPQDTRDGFHLYSAQASFAFPARRSGPSTLAQEASTIFGLYPSLASLLDSFL